MASLRGPELPLRVLVADHEPAVRESCVGILRLGGFEVAQCGRGDEALELLQRHAFDIVLAEEGIHRVDWLTLVRAALTTSPDTLVILMTSNPTLESSLEALRLGAWYYLPKPFTATQLQILMGRAAHFRVTTASQPAPLPPPPPSGVPTLAAPPVGRAPAFRHAVELACRVAASHVPVWLTGESGCGKELLAHFIHHNSGRTQRPFVPVNCAALPEGLLESEMFGHRKGAFTGAVREKPGLLEAAHGGTMFLDELLEMSKPTQAKLLRVIQDGIVRRVGSESTDAVVNVRFIAATNGDPEAAVKAGVCREDLYYRLNVVRIHVPPLRERQEDIPLLANLFLATYWRRNRPKGAPVPKLSEPAIRALCRHPWHGNVRELQNVIECATVLVAPEQEIGPWDLSLLEETEPELAIQAALAEPSLDGTFEAARARILAEFEVQYFQRLVNKTEGNMARAARLAGVDRTTLYRIQRRTGLQKCSPFPAWIVQPDEDRDVRKPSPTSQHA